MRAKPFVRLPRLSKMSLITRRSLSAVLLLSVLLGLTPAVPASAQAASLALVPRTGDPPTVRGSLSGYGWCYPAAGVTVSGPGVVGGGSVAADNSLSGFFSVTGDWGDIVSIEVVASCRGGESRTSAQFTFNPLPTGTQTPGPIITWTPSPTQTPSATPTLTQLPSATPTLMASPSATPTMTPTTALPAPAPSTGTVAILGCEPAAEDVSIAFFALSSSGASTGTPAFVAPAVGTSDPHLFAFDGPMAPPGILFSLDVNITSPVCPADADPAPRAWMSGEPFSVYVLPGTSELLASSLGSKPPQEQGTAEISAFGAWVTYHEAYGSAAGYSQLFKWTTDLATAANGELQASVYPFPTDPASNLTTPPGVVFIKDVPCVNCTFLADLTSLYPKSLLNQGTPIQILLKKMELSVKSAWNSMKLAANLIWNQVTGGGGVNVAMGSPMYSSGGSPSDALTAGNGAPLMVTEYYFRVVPMSGEEVVGAATNTVRIKFMAGSGLTITPCVGYNCPTPSPLPPTPKPYIVEIISYHGIIPPQSGHVDCYLATKTTTVPLGPSKLTYPKDTQFCPPKEEDPEWYEVVFNLIVDGINWISEAVETLKSTVVDALAEFVPDPPCGKTCLSNVLDGTLAALGIPPSIPNFEELMDQGIDYLAEQAVGQIPIPANVIGDFAIAEWKKTAEDEFKQGMQEGIEAAKIALSESVDYVPDGVPVVADPLGFTQPPTIVLRITRDPNVPEAPGTCSMSSNPAEANLSIYSTVTQATLTAAMQIFNDWHIGPDLKAGKWEWLYEVESVALPTLPSDESMTVPVILTPGLTWTTDSGWASNTDKIDAWWALYQGGKATISVFSSPCTAGDTLGVQADGAFEAP